MKVRQLIKLLKNMNQDAFVEVLTTTGKYRKIIDVAEEYSNLVSIGIGEIQGEKQ